MNQPTYLKPWLANWNLGIRIILSLVLLSAVTQFVSFSLSQNYMISYLGAQPEDITFAIQITYVGILANFPLLFRFVRYFEMRNFLATSVICGIVLSIACLYTTDIILFFIIRFLQGVVICSLAGSMLIMISGSLKLEVRQAVGSSIFFGTVLSSSVLIGIVAANVSLNADFKTLYIYLIIFQLFILGLILLAFNGKSGIRPYPLYQLDWIGSIFFITAATGLAYTMLYGSKYYWFADPRIKVSSIISILAASLYFLRQSIIKRPLIDISAFRYRNFWIGLFLLGLYYGMKESINLVYSYTAVVLQWSSLQIVLLGLCNISGLLVFMAITAWLLVRYKNATFQFLIVGFSMLLFYHLWMYFLFTPDLSFADLVLPMFFQGAASGILFVPIMIFTLTSIPASTGITGLLLEANTRFITLLNASAGFYTLQLYYNQLYKESFLIHLTSIDEQTQERLNGLTQVFSSKGFSPDQATDLANASLAKAVGVQSQLLTNRAVFLFISVMISIILVLVLLVALFRIYACRYKPKPVITG
jgi:DHA2 family multidrug resistance protein